MSSAPPSLPSSTQDPSSKRPARLPPQHARRTGDLQRSSSTVDQQDNPPLPRSTPSRASSLSQSARSFVSESASRVNGHLGSRFVRGQGSADHTTVSAGPSSKDQQGNNGDEHADGQSYLPDDEIHDIMNHPDVVLANDTTRFHAGDRKPVDPYWRPRWEMANFHVSLWNALEQLYLHAPYVQPKEIEAFARYGASVVHAIDTHHDVEEEYYFPSLEVAISMQANLEQHASFDDGMRALKFYLRSCISDPTIFNASTVLSIIDTFAVYLATHFADELDTLNPEILREYFSVADLNKQGTALAKAVVKDYKRHLYTALPVVIVNTPPGREWPSLPPMYRRILLPIFLARKYKSSWKYGKWPNSLNVFGGRSSAALSNLSMSPSNRPGALAAPSTSSFSHRGMSFNPASGTVKSQATTRGGSGHDGMPLSTSAGTETEAEKLARQAINRKASVRTEASTLSVGGADVDRKKSLPPQPGLAE